MKGLGAVLFAVLLLSPSLLLGQSVLQFPRVVATSDLYTGIAVGNPTGAEASVTFTAFQPDGTPLGGGARNPVTVMIPAAGQHARLFTEIFGVPAFNGWVQASSATSGLTGFFINGSSGLSDLNGAGSVAPAVDLILPLAAEESVPFAAGIAVTRTEVTIVNVNPEPASVSLALYANDGAILSTKKIIVPARGLARQTLGLLFGLNDLRAASHVRVGADRPVVAHEVVADFQIPGTNIRRETAALAGGAPAPGKTYIIPQFATGGQWLSLIGLVNSHPLPQEVTLTAFREDGSPWPVSSNPQHVTLPGNGALRTTAGDLFGFPSEILNTGWIQVTSQEGLVTAYSGYGNVLTSSFALVEATPTEDASQYAVFSHVAEGAGFYTGLTVVNAGTETAEVEFYTLRADGNTVGRAAFSLEPNQKVARLFRELLPASLQQVGGWGFLRSSQPVVGAALFGSSGYALANIPQQLPARDFIPPAQTSGAITGTVRSDGAGISGVEITLSGPVSTVGTTDGEGRYVFAQLPPGQYKVVASRSGAVVVPTEHEVALDRENAGAVDFDAGGIAPANAPALSFITPATVFAGTGSQTVRIIGANFTPASVVRFNDRTAPTTYLSSAELAAAVAASLLAQPVTLEVTVDTPPPGGGRSRVLDFAVSEAPSDPLIAGRARVGSFPAGVAIDASRRRALVTNQAGDNVTVLDLNTFQSVAEIRVGRSPAEGIDIHPGKDIALVANPGSNNVSVIDLAANTVTRTIPVGRFPIGLAIHEEINRAYVVNGEDDTVSVINLDTFEVVGRIGVGSRPSNVAINPRTNQAVVTNRGGNSASVIDLNTGSTLASVPVGEFPRGVAVHPETNRAVVVNANSNSVSILNLTNGSVEGTVGVGDGPTSAALHLPTNSIIVTNSGVTRANPVASGISSVSVINLDRLEVIAEISAGSGAFGVAVDQERQMAAVAGYGSNDVTLVRIPNPAPRITDIEPKAFPVGRGSFPVTVRGSGFVPSSVITLNTQPLPTVFVSTIELRGTLSPGFVDQLLHAGNISIEGETGTVSRAVQPVEFNIGVENPGPGGGANPPSDGVTSIRPQNAVPVLLSLSPNEIQLDTTDLTLTLNGNNFNSTSIVNFGGLQFSPSSSSLNSMTVVVPQNQLGAGTVQVTVTNPAPGGGTSAALPFEVYGEMNPAPSVTSVSPSSIPAGSGAVSVTVMGTGFIRSTTAALAGAAGAVTGGSISFVLPAALTEAAGTLSGLISTPAPGGGAATFLVNIVNPLPAIAGFTPPSVEAGAASVTLQVSGTNFRSNSRITLGGVPVSTAFESATLLSGTIASGLLAEASELRVGVTNPAPGGGSSEGGLFRVRARTPVITSVSPDRPRPGQTVRIFGGNFRSDSVVLLRGAAISSGFVSATELTAAIPSPISFGSADLVVSNPALGPLGQGTSSNPVTITITDPAPTLSTLSPDSGISGTTVAITLIGANFGPTTEILFGGAAIPTTFVNSGALTGSVTLGAPGNVAVTAVNPGGFVSNELVFAVIRDEQPPGNPAPAIASVSPDLVAFGTPGQTITITGTNFLSTTTVTVSGNAVTIANRTPTSLVIAVPGPLLAPGGSKTITVTNPAPGGGSAVATFLANAFSLMPLQVEKLLGRRQQFVTGDLPGTLVWSVNGADGGDTTYGTISNTGFYIAPEAMPSPATFRVCARLSTDASTLACAIMKLSPVPSSGQDIIVFNDLNPFDETNAAAADNKLMVRNLVSFTGDGPRLSGTVAQFDCGRASAFSNACTDFTTMKAEIESAGMTVSQVNSSSGSVTSIPSDVKALFLWLPAVPFAPIEINTLKNFTLEGGRIVFIGESDGFYGTTGLEVQNDLLIKMGALMRNIGQAVDCGEPTMLPAGSLRTHQVTAGMTQVAIECASVITLGPNDVPLFYDLSNTRVLAGAARIDMTPLPADPPEISSITPDNAAAGSELSVTITGRNFVPGSPSFGTNVTIEGGNVTVSNINVVDFNTLTATLTIDLNASATTRAITVTTPNGTVTSESFDVTAPPPPELTGINPSLGVAGTQVSVTFTGTNFVDGAAVEVAGSGVTADGSHVVSSTSLTATFTIALDAALGARDVTVTTAGGTSNAVQFVVSASFDGAIFAGTISTDWSDPLNWSTGSVPDSTTSVLIPSAAARQPILTANVPVLNLTVETGAALETAAFTITVGGSVDAGGAITGTGTVLMTGNGTIQGTLPDVIVAGTVSFPVSTSTVTGNLIVQSNGILDVSDATTIVTGNFTTTGAAVLRMHRPAGTLTISGDVIFDGGNTIPHLRAGTLHVKGNFVTTGSHARNFAASGTHLTVLNGTVTQSVSMNFPGITHQRFENLRIDNTAGVVFNTNTHVAGNFEVTVAAAISGPGTVTVHRNVTTAPDSAVTLTGMAIGGTMAVSGAFSPAVTTFTGTNQIVQPGLGYQNVVVTGTAIFKASSTVTVAGNLTVESQNGTAEIAGSVAVSGNLLTSAVGKLKMVEPAAVLAVDGSATFDGGNTEGLLDAGTIEVKGNFTATSSSFANFAPTNHFRVVLKGTAQQTVTMAFPGIGSQRFRYLEIQNTAGIVMGSHLVVGEALASLSTGVRERIIGHGRSLTVLGLIVEGLELDNVQFVVELGDRSVLFEDVAFRNYPDAATRIRISAHRGTHHFRNIDFVEGVPITGFLVNATDSKSADDEPFTLVISTNPYIPPGAANPRTITNHGAVVVWSD